MGQQHRLGVLHVGAPGNDGIAGLLGTTTQHLDEIQHLPRQGARLVTQVHAQQGGDLVVAGPTSTDASAQICPGTLDEATLKCSVDVLVLLRRGEGTVGDIGVKLIERRDEPVELLVGEQPRPVQNPGVRLGTGNVVTRQSPVELRGDGQCSQGLGRTTGEPAAPQRQTTGRFGYRVDVVGHDRPFMRIDQPGSGLQHFSQREEPRCLAVEARSRACSQPSEWWIEYGTFGSPTSLESARHGPFRLAFGVPRLDRLAFVPFPLSGGNGDLNLRVPVLEVQLQRDDRLARGIHLTRDLGNLAFVEQQFAFAHDVVIAPGTKRIFGDVQVVEPHLTMLVHLGKGIHQGGLACSQ